jgi:hypothetical protein
MGISNKIIGGVLKFETFANFPVTGKDDSLYLDEATDTLYHWDGTVYVSISGDSSEVILSELILNADGIVTQVNDLCAVENFEIRMLTE